MKIFVKNLFILLILTFFLILIFKYSNLITIYTIKSIEIWITKLFPSLFIMFILNDLIINTNTCYYLNKVFYPIGHKILHFSGESSLAFVLSIFSGTPANAYVIKELLNNKQITLKDANQLLMFTFFSNPLFLYNILSLTFPKNIVFKLIFIHYITNIFIAYIYKNKSGNYTLKYQVKTNNFFYLLESSIKKSFNTLLMILGVITFFMIISNLITSLFNFNEYLSLIIKGIFEITQCLNDLNNLNSSLFIKEIIAIAIISFGGLSIHMQIFSIISDTLINYKYFLKGRLIHSLISTLLIILSYLI